MQEPGTGVASGEPERGQPTAPGEKAVAAVGLLLVLGTSGYLLYSGLTAGDRTPDIRIVQRAVKPQGDGFVVEVDVRNEGGRTAASLTVEGELKLPGGEKETSDLSLDYVPSHSHRRAGLFFEHDPRKYPLTLRPKGYQEP